jgi:hypothetical protein
MQVNDTCFYLQLQDKLQDLLIFILTQTNAKSFGESFPLTNPTNGYFSLSPFIMVGWLTFFINNVTTFLCFIQETQKNATHANVDLMSLVSAKFYYKSNSSISEVSFIIILTIQKHIQENFNHSCCILISKSLPQSTNV